MRCTWALLILLLIAPLRRNAESEEGSKPPAQTDDDRLRGREGQALTSYSPTTC